MLQASKRCPVIPSKINKPIDGFLGVRGRETEETAVEETAVEDTAVEETAVEETAEETAVEE